MEFNVSCPDTSAMREIGASAFVFATGGIASYIFYRYLPSSQCETTALGSPELVKQVIGLKDEIKYLKSKLATALTDVGRGMDDIRASQFRISQMHLGQVTSPPNANEYARNSDGSIKRHSTGYAQESLIGQIKRSSFAQEPSGLLKKNSNGYAEDSSSAQLKRASRGGSTTYDRASQDRGAPPSLPDDKVNPANSDPHSMISLINRRRSSLLSTDDDDDFVSVKESVGDCGSYAPEALRGILEEIDKLNMGSDEDREKAMNMLHDYEVSYPNSAQLKWRMARAHLWRYGDCERPEGKRQHAISALRCATDALRMNIHSPDVHKWYAVSLATSLDFKSPSEKMEKNSEILRHLEKAIELDPLEPMPYYIKGKWCWGVYKLRWIEKKLTNAMYGAPPSVSFDEVVESFLKAEDLAPGFYKANRLYLAKCYLEKEEFETSKDWLLAAHTLPIRTKEDKLTQSIIEELLKEMREKVDWF